MDAHPPYPNAADRETHGFFEAAAEGRLVYRACKSCERGLHPPTAHCPWCGSWETGWREAKGTGRLYTWTTVTHQIHPGFPAPYTLVVVTLDEAPEVRLMGHIDGAPELAADMPMEVWFQALPDGPTLPQWRPAA
jgi:uncharacterized OB-fold protein